MNTTVKKQWIVDADKIYSSTKSFPFLPAGMYTVNRDQTGTPYLSSTVESDEVIIDSKSKIDNDVVKEIADFWSLKANYKALNIPHKRGILLYGLPGTGKSCLIRRIIKAHVKSNGIVIYTPDDEGIELALELFKRTEFNRNILVVMEDIDEIVTNYGDRSICELFDGAKAVLDSYVVLSTTNYIDRLPQRLVNRPSRFDTVIEVKPPTETMISIYLKTLYPILSAKQLKEMSKALVGYSFAHVKEAGLAVCLYKYTIKQVIDKFKQTYRVTNAKYREELD